MSYLIFYTFASVASLPFKFWLFLLLLTTLSWVSGEKWLDWAPARISAMFLSVFAFTFLIFVIDQIFLHQYDLVDEIFRAITPSLDTLSDVPLNIWAYLIPITAPLLVFAIGPNLDIRFRISRIVIAIACTYALLNLALHTDNALERKSFEACMGDPHDAWRYNQCKHHINIADGASIIFFAIFGWIPAMAYTAFWETLWLAGHRKSISHLGKAYKGLWVSLTLIILSIPVWIFAAGILGWFTLFTLCPDFIPGNQCFKGSHPIP